MRFNELQKKKISFVSLGCDKNRVDLEKMIALFKYANFQITNVDEANIVIINTCAFILDARKESIDNILNVAQNKTRNLEKLVVTGCLNNMGYNDLESSLPEVDKFVKIEDNHNILYIIAQLYDVKIPDDFTKQFKEIDRVITTPKHYAYLKIADGCNNFCAYCTIPFIRGRYKSVCIEQLVNEAKLLVDGGVNELILVAQDVTKYGEDLYKKLSLVPLIRELSKIDKLKHIRLLYCYPDLINDELIYELATNDKLCKYIDIPLQHINNDILKSMNRRITTEQIENLILKLRQHIPKISIRTTFIIGLPGEGDKEFKQLCNFVTKNQLDNVGFFKYSKEEGTRAATFKNQVPAKIKTQRLKEISQLQYAVVLQNNQKFIGKTMQVVVDEITDKYAVCRSEYQCPTVDSVIFVPHKNKMIVGHYYNVQIKKILKYDLEGELL